MSDGPHRSLPLRKHWKKVAEWADNLNYGCGDVVAVLSEAVVRDFRREVPDSVLSLLKKEFCSRETMLPAFQTQPLAVLDREHEGSPMACLIADCAEYQLATGDAGLEGLETALRSGIHERLLGVGQQMEEHYVRDPHSTPERAATVRNRLMEATQALPLHDLTLQLLGAQPTQRMHVALQSGLDEGVPRR
jgi:hypothetical protein